MPDPRVQNFAQIIVDYSTRVKKGDLVAIRGFPLTPAATPLINALTRKVLQAGGLPHLIMTPPEYRELLYKYASEAQIQHINPFSEMITERFDVDIRISSSQNTNTLSNLDPDRLNQIRRSYSELLDTWFQRTSEGSLRWLTTRFPTNAYAQDAEMSLEEYEQFFYKSCYADLDDPIAEFNKMSAGLGKVEAILNGGKAVELNGPDIDLKFSVQDRIFIPCIGDHNLPDGEIYCAPVEDSVEGWVRFSFPCKYLGVEVQGVELEFKAGKVVRATAEKNESYLTQTLQVDEGASRLGEFGIGLNEGIDRFTGSMLFDEKIAGTIHLALGAGYPKSGSVNKSSIHWDMLVDMRTDSEITLDGERIYADGVFIDV